MDVLWFRVSHKPTDSAETMGRFDRGSILVMLDRGDYWQCAYVIAKGSAETLKAIGIEKFRERIVKLMPFLADRVNELLRGFLARLAAGEPAPLTVEAPR